MQQAYRLSKDIESKTFLPVYVLCGDETFFIDLVLNAIDDNVLLPEEKESGRQLYYGTEAKWQDIINMAQQFPMFSSKSLFIVKDARLTKADMDVVVNYCINPPSHSVLVIILKNKLDKRSKLYKIISPTGGFLQTTKIYDNQVPTFVAQQIKNFGWLSDDKINYLIAEQMGNNLTRIRNELSKLIPFLKNGERVSLDLVEKHIGISKTYNNFELVDAIGEKNKNKSIKIAVNLSKNTKENPFILTVAALYNFFSNLMQYQTIADKSSVNVSRTLGVKPFLVNKYNLAARNYQLKSITKIISILRESYGNAVGVGSNASDEEKMKELILRILYVN